MEAMAVVVVGAELAGVANDDSDSGTEHRHQLRHDYSDYSHSLPALHSHHRPHRLLALVSTAACYLSSLAECLLPTHRPFHLAAAAIAVATTLAFLAIPAAAIENQLHTTDTRPSGS